MNPLSPFTYYVRHKGQALLLLALIASLTLGVFVLVGVLSTAAASIRDISPHLTRITRIVAGEALAPDVVAQIRAHPDVAAVLPENGLMINVPSPVGGPPGTHLILGVMEDDLALVMEVCDLRLKEGRLIEPRAAEVMLFEETARALDLQIGDPIGHDIDEDFYPGIATELMLVGILESIPSEAGPEVQLSFASYEYLGGHELYQPRLSNLLIIPRSGRRASLNGFLEALVDGSGGAASTRLEIFESEAETMRRLGTVMSGMYIFADGVVAVSAALVVGMVNRIGIARRLPELGLLHAAGYEKRCLVRRLVLEIAVITGIGWGGGLLLSGAVSILFNATLVVVGSSVIDLSSPVPFLFTLPIPTAVVSWVTVSVRRVLNRLDPVAIIERGKLSLEEDPRRGGSRFTPTAARSARNPLSSWTFYLRHSRRSLALLVATGLMILGVAFPAFVSTMMIDSIWPLAFSYTSHASVISPPPTYQAVDPAVLAQIRAHPAVAHVIPVKAMTVMIHVIPFEFPLPVYGVREADLQVLLDVYDLHIGEGELLEPRSGQIVVTSGLARNRGLSVGDTVGRSVHELDSMPTELTVVGLLDSQTSGLTERKGYRTPAAPRWAGFASYEFVEHHERYSATPMHALVISVEGREVEVETWLEESINSPRVVVETFGTLYRFFLDFTLGSMRILVITESILAVVAAGALAILNLIFVTQRRDEFGILHGVGHSRGRLIARTLRESASLVGTAWLIGTACCLALLLGAQAFIYVPRGMSLDLTNPMRWLFTLPIPLAVVVASAGTIAWALSRLDPVAVIERR